MAEVRSWDVAVEHGLVDLRDEYRDVQAELNRLLAELGREDWSAPTMLPGWDVHSVALHLLGDDFGRLSGAWLARARPADEVAFEVLAAAIEQSNEDWVAAARRIPPPLVVDLLGLTADRTSALFAAADLWARGTPVAWTGSGPSPLWLDLAREYTERWVHQQQIREAVGGALLDDPRWLWPVLDVFMLCLPRALAEVKAERGSTLEVEVTDGAGGTWNVTRGPDRWHVAGNLSSDPSAKITLSADVAWRWLAGLLPRESVERSVRPEGDERLWRPMLRAVAVMTTAR